MAQGATPREDQSVPLLERKYLLSFLLVTTLFFSWALAAQLNDVLIRQFQKAMDLNRGQAGLIQTAFYGGYFFGAIPAALFMRRFGYKAGILLGLSLYCAGALLFYPAAEIRIYAIFLAALYAIAFGLSFLETAANPYISVMGRPETGPARLNLAQSFYGVGAFLGPYLGGIFIFSGIDYSPAEIQAMTPEAVEAYRSAEAKAVQMPYLVVAGGVALLALLIAMSRFPKVEEEAAGPDAENARFWHLFRYPHLMWGAVAQFFYVGAQVAVWSYFIDFTLHTVEITETNAAHLLSYGFLALLVGRFSGAWIMKFFAPNKLLSLYAVIAIGLCAVTMFGSGWVAVWAMWATTFFMSIMFPTIFTLGIAGLGPLTKMGSSLMIMAIIGAALFPPLMGYLSEAPGGSLQSAMIVPLVGFAVVLIYGLFLYKPRGPLLSSTEA